MKKYKLIVFDVDGTILQGFDFSWKLVWNFLGYDDKIRKDIMKRYLNQEVSYEEWCDLCRDKFREKKLKKNNFKEITKDVLIAKNFFELMNELKNMNIKTMIVSGGIDTFLESKIPNYEELFDYVYINKVEYDENDVIKKIVPTKYDFANKITPVEEFAKKNNIKREEIVFLCDNFNDLELARYVGLPVGVNVKDERLKEIIKHNIEEDDIIKVLDLIK